MMSFENTQSGFCRSLSMKQLCTCANWGHKTKSSRLILITGESSLAMALLKRSRVRLSPVEQNFPLEIPYLACLNFYVKYPAIVRLRPAVYDALLVSMVVLKIEGIEYRQTYHRREATVLKDGIDKSAAVVLATLATEEVSHEEIVHGVDVTVHEGVIISVRRNIVNRLLEL